MLHFTCDLCGCKLGEQRYVVKAECYPAFDPEVLDETDLDADHLQDVAEMIAEVEITGEYDLEDCGTKQFRFDLCPNCQQRFVKDPLNRDVRRHVNFSEN